MNQITATLYIYAFVEIQEIQIFKKKLKSRQNGTGVILSKKNDISPVKKSCNLFHVAIFHLVVKQKKFSLWEILWRTWWCIISSITVKLLKTKRDSKNYTEMFNESIDTKILKISEVNHTLSISYKSNFPTAQIKVFVRFVFN